MNYSQDFEVIIFTHKRAMQLHFLLDSLYKQLSENTKVHIIHHESSDHDESYILLKNHFKKKEPNFYSWGKSSNFELIKRIILRPFNIIWLIRFPAILKKYCDFQKTLEKILKLVNSSYVMLLTDDQHFINSLPNTKKILKKISKEPRKLSYWSHVCPDFKHPYNFQKKLSSSDDLTFRWDTKQYNQSSLFAYRFHVDGTIYNKTSLYELLKKTIYHLPTTLEGVGLWESRFRGYFRYGFMSVKRIVVGIQANNIQTMSDTPHANFNIDLLMKAYCAGFRMQNDYKNFDDLEYIYVPKKLQFRNRKLSLRDINYDDLCKYI
jgi:hypothetical protein